MRPNPRDIKSLKKFFKEYEGLTTNQLSIVAGVSNFTINFWKSKCGLIGDINRKKKISKDPIPENWDTKEWFEKAYEKMGYHAIACLIGKDNDWLFVKRRLKRYGIKPKTVKERENKSDNPCCDEGWLHYYYAKRDDYLKWCKKNKMAPCDDGGQGLSLHECAALAGVSHQAIHNWLALYKMKARSISDTDRDKEHKPVSMARKRAARDRYFESYRAGKINMTIGQHRFSNGTRVDKAQTINKRFNTEVRGASSHPSSQE